MNCKSSFDPKKGNQKGRPFRGGHILVETLLLVGLASFVCSSALNTSMKQQQRIKEFESAVKATQAADSLNWAASETFEGKRVWTRHY